MKIIDWNISWAGNISSKIEYLKKVVSGDSFIIILQEVKFPSYNALRVNFEDIANIEYSLTYRVPGKYDTDSRKLGVAIIVSKDIKIMSAFVLERSLLPDRTLLVDTVVNDTALRILALHSITGCHHLKAKEIQYFSFAEAIDIYKPDIVGIDANEPQIDHYDISQMKFFDNYQKGNGCKTFFDTMGQNALVDAFVKDYNKSAFVEGEYLTTSHIIKRSNKKVRYDFLFVNEEKMGNYSCKYEYEDAVKAGSDHALIMITDQEPCSSLQEEQGNIWCDIEQNQENISTINVNKVLGKCDTTQPVIKKESRKRSNNFTFSEWQIPAGAILQYRLDPSITCEVADERKVKFKGEIMYLTSVAKKCLGKDSGVCGPEYFTYKGAKLWDINGRIDN